MSRSAVSADPHITPQEEVFDLLPHGVALVDGHGVVSATNRLWRAAASEGDPLIAEPGDRLVARLQAAGGHHGPTTEHIADGFLRLLDGRGRCFQAQYQLDGTDPTGSRWFLVAAERLDTGGLIVTRTETTVQHGMDEMLTELAFHDGLTGLPNRSLLLDRVRMALVRAQRLGLRPLITFADIDGFKAVNDRFGHEAGDAVLIEVAHRLASAVREGDTCGRWGGDEFVLVIELGTRSDADRVLDRLGAVMHAPFDLPGGQSIALGLSVGAVVAQGGERVEDLITRADETMYRAKRAGGDPVVVEARAQRRSRARLRPAST